MKPAAVAMASVPAREDPVRLFVSDALAGIDAPGRVGKDFAAKVTVNGGAADADLTSNLVAGDASVPQRPDRLVLGPAFPPCLFGQRAVARFRFTRRDHDGLAGVGSGCAAAQYFVCAASAAASAAAKF